MINSISFSYKFLSFSFLVSLIVAFCVWFYFPFYTIKGADKALDGILLLSSISLGFYGACLSVLASIFNTKVVKEIMRDSEDRKEFLIVSCSTLLVGFLTVLITIVYQVMLKNDGVTLNFVNSLWFFIITMFLCMKVLFVLIIFMILFNNKEDKDTAAYDPPLKQTH